MLDFFSKKNIYPLIFLLALLSGFFWSYNDFGKSISNAISNDDEYYSRLARELVEQGEFVSYKTDKTRAPVDPLYPLFIASIYKIFGVNNYDAVRIVQLIFFGLTVVLAYLLARSLLSFKSAAVVGIFSSFCYPLASFCGQLYKEILFTFLIVALVYFLVKAQQENKTIWFVLAGLSFGLAYLTNSILLFFPGLVLIVFLLIQKKDFFKKAYFFNVLGFFIISIFFPLFIFFNSSDITDARGASLAIFLDRKTFIEQEIKGEYLEHFVGMFFGYYFAEKMDPKVDEKLMISYSPLSSQYAQARQKSVSDKEFSIKENSIAIRKIIKSPFDFLSVVLLDFLQFNGPVMPNKIISSGGPMQNMFVNGSHPGIKQLVKVVILISLRIAYWLFCGLIIYGIFRSAKEWKKFIIPYSIIIYFNLLFPVVFGLARYAIPIYFFYIIFFVIGADYFWKQHGNKFDFLPVRKS